MEVATLNNSRVGKVLVVALVVVAAVVTWVAMERHRDEVQAQTPLPGEGPGDPCAVWFVGSSTMHRWENLPADMAPWRAVKRGFGGATFAQLTARLSHDPALVPPRGIVLYAGENDLAEGSSVQQVVGELQRFLALKTRMFGTTPVILISLKPSPARWPNRPAQLSYNAAARKIADERPDIDYVEIGPLLMAGEFPGDHYVEDGVHLRPEGYRLWLPALNEALRRNLGEPACATPLATAAPAA